MGAFPASIQLVRHPSVIAFQKSRSSCNIAAVCPQSLTLPPLENLGSSPPKLAAHSCRLWCRQLERLLTGCSWAFWPRTRTLVFASHLSRDDPKADIGQRLRAPQLTTFVQENCAAALLRAVRRTRAGGHTPSLSAAGVEALRPTYPKHRGASTSRRAQRPGSEREAIHRPHLRSSALDGPAAVGQFLREVSLVDLVVEMVQNDLDAGATWTSFDFGEQGILYEWDGEPLNSKAWSQLESVIRAGGDVEAKRGGIGSKNMACARSSF